MEEENLKLAKNPGHHSLQRVTKKTSLEYIPVKDLDNRNHIRSINASFISENELEFRREIKDMKEKTEEQRRRIEELEHINKNKTTRIEEIANECFELKDEKQELEKKLEFYEKRKKDGKKREPSNLESLSRSNLLNKCKMTGKWANNIEEENAELKVKVTELEVNRMMRIKSEKILPKFNSPLSSLRSSINPQEILV